MNVEGIVYKKAVIKIFPSTSFKEKHLTLFSVSLVFIITYIYLYYFCDYILFFQENLSLFVFSRQYAQPFLGKAGGLLEYAGNFLKQGYYNSIYGSFIISLILALFALVLSRISKELAYKGPVPMFIVILATSLLLLMQTNFNWLLRNNLGFLLTTIYFLISIISEKDRHRIVSLFFFPLFYYLTGAFAWIYLGMIVTYFIVFETGLHRFLYPGIVIIIALLTFLMYREIIFFQSNEALLISPFSSREHFMHPEILYILIGIIILFPLLVKIFSFLKSIFNIARAISFSSVLTVNIIAVFLMAHWYNPKIANLFHLEKLVFRQDWDAVIEHQETVQLSNIVAQFYYNLALSDNGELCEKLFYGRQDFGPGALIIPWDNKAGVNNVSRGVYFFYTVGLINEAHRWAYESMVAQGYNPENIKLLIKTNLINGHFLLAEKYLDVLKKTLHYRSWAEKYESLLNRPDLIQVDPELGAKLKLLPKNDFSISVINPQTNLPLLIDANPENKIAFEYLISWYLLEKNIGVFSTEIERIKKVSYKKIPRHIEEAILLYNMETGRTPDLGFLKISNETTNRFRQYQEYVDPFFGPKSPGQTESAKQSSHTFWYYFDFK